MTSSKHTFLALLTGLVLLVLVSCQQPGVNKPGSEYMPDMGHSIAYEANVFNYYYLNTWDSASVVKLKDMSEPRNPVAGTVPRGYAGVSFAGDSDDQAAMLKTLHGQADGSIAVPLNGHVPYYYGNTEDERTRAIAEIIANPFPITADGLARGKALYDIFCGICHGPKGDGAGYLVRDPNPAAGDAGGKYPAAPANFLLDEFVASSNGRYYHAIMFGKNMMGGYSDKVSYEERWQVIHYIRSLQAKAKGLEYSPDANTLNPDYGVPGGSLAPQMALQEEAPATDEPSMPEGGEQQSDH